MRFHYNKLYPAVKIAMLLCVTILICYTLYHYSSRKLSETEMTPLESETTSSSSDSLTARLAEFKNRTGYPFRSSVNDISYYIITSPNHLGPHRLDYKFAIKVDPLNIDKWLDRFNRTDKFSINYRKDILPLEIPWSCQSTPEYYYAPSGGYAIAYREEGVIIFRLYQ